MEGLIANKMILDTVFEAPQWFPYWLKSVSFFFIVIPMAFVTTVDDIIGSYIVY